MVQCVIVPDGIFYCFWYFGSFGVRYVRILENDEQGVCCPHLSSGQPDACRCSACWGNTRIRMEAIFSTVRITAALWHRQGMQKLRLNEGCTISSTLSIHTPTFTYVQADSATLHSSQKFYNVVHLKGWKPVSHIALFSVRSLCSWSSEAVSHPSYLPRSRRLSGV